MSAEAAMREAANKMRVDASAGYQRGHIPMREVRFKRAVADLLDGQAAMIHRYGDFSDIEGMGDANALAVARAYLGSDA